MWNFVLLDGPAIRTKCGQPDGPFSAGSTKSFPRIFSIGKGIGSQRCVTKGEREQPLLHPGGFDDHLGKAGGEVIAVGPRPKIADDVGDQDSRQAH